MDTTFLLSSHAALVDNEEIAKECWSIVRKQVNQEGTT